MPMPTKTFFNWALSFHSKTKSNIHTTLYFLNFIVVRVVDMTNSGKLKNTVSASV